MLVSFISDPATQRVLSQPPPRVDGASWEELARVAGPCELGSIWADGLSVAVRYRVADVYVVNRREKLTWSRALLGCSRLCRLGEGLLLGGLDPLLVIGPFGDRIRFVVGDHGPSGVAAVGQPYQFLSFRRQVRDGLEKVVCWRCCVVAVHQRPVRVEKVQCLLRQSGNCPTEFVLVLAGGPAGIPRPWRLRRE